MRALLKKTALAIILVPLAGLVIFFSVTRPSNDRTWESDQAMLPYATIEGNLATIHNIRNFSYISTSEYAPAYYESTFNLDGLKKAYYIVSPFTGPVVGLAHTFLSFEFEDDRFVAVSVEIRKEKGEKYSPYRGFFNQYELMYVIADERDVVRLRSNFRQDPVYVYPLRIPEEKLRSLFTDILERTNELAERPEFYNTLANTCTTNLATHINKVSPKRVPLSYKLFFPEYSDELVYDLGLIDTNLSFEDMRKKFLINERAMAAGESSDFSRKIRQ